MPPDIERTIGRLEASVEAVTKGQEKLFEKIDDLHGTLREYIDNHNKQCSSRSIRAECQHKFESLQDDRSKIKGALQFIMSAVALFGAVVSILYKWRT